MLHGRNALDKAGHHFRVIEVEPRCRAYAQSFAQKGGIAFGIVAVFLWRIDMDNVADALRVAFWILMIAFYPLRYRHKPVMPGGVGVELSVDILDIAVIVNAQVSG